MEKPILVLGATGRHGGTGGIVARALLERKIPVRALVRTLDERIEPLRALGAEVVKADLHERLSLLPALDGIKTAYFTYPIAGGIVEAAANFASAGRATGLQRLVVMSMGPSHPLSPSHLGRAQWLAEDLFEWAGFKCLHLRIAAAFLENIEMLHRHDIEGDGVIRNAFPDIPMKDRARSRSRWGDSRTYPRGRWQPFFLRHRCFLALGLCSGAGRPRDRSLSGEFAAYAVQDARSL